MAHTFAPNRLPPSALSHNWHTDAVDRRASDIARSVLAGIIDESAGRWEIAALVTEAGVARSVAPSIALPNDRQSQEDTAQLLTELVQDKIAGPHPALDLGLIAEGKSVSGWARKLAGSDAARSTARRVLHRTTYRTVPVSHTDHRMVDIAVGIDGSSGNEADECYEAFLVLAASYQEQARAKRPYELIHLSCRFLCDAYGLPTPCRGIDLPNYEALVERMETSEATVLDDIVDTLEDPDAGPRGLAVLFADASIDQLERFVGLPPEIAHRVALSALTPMTPPHKAHLAAMRDSLTTLVGGKHAAGRLVRSWVSACTEVDRSERCGSGRPAVRPLAERRLAQSEWVQTCNELVDRGVTQLGLTPDAVRAALDREINQVIQRACLTAA